MNRLPESWIKAEGEDFGAGGAWAEPFLFLASLGITSNCQEVWTEHFPGRLKQPNQSWGRAGFPNRITHTSSQVLKIYRHPQTLNIATVILTFFEFTKLFKNLKKVMRVLFRKAQVYKKLYSVCRPISVPSWSLNFVCALKVKNLLMGLPWWSSG